MWDWNGGRHSGLFPSAWGWRQLRWFHGVVIGVESAGTIGWRSRVQWLAVAHMTEMADEWWSRREGPCWVLFITSLRILWWTLREIGLWIRCAAAIAFLTISTGGTDMHRKDYVAIRCGNISINWRYSIRTDWYHRHDTGFLERIFRSVLPGERELISRGYVARVMWLENYRTSSYLDESENQKRVHRRKLCGPSSKKSWVRT